MPGRSVYEDRWRDRLRRLLRPEDRSGSEIIVNAQGEPRLVVSHGNIIGMRRKDGSIAHFRPRRLEEVPETEWVLLRDGGWRERWR